MFFMSNLKWGTQSHLRCNNAAIIDIVGASMFNSNESAEIVVVREKLIHDQKTATDRMKDPILREESVEDIKTLKLWNQRMRQKKKEIKAPITVSGNAKRDFTSTRIDGGNNVSSRLRTNINSNKIEKPKLSDQLLRKEIEEDFIACLGRQPRQKPTERPRVVQKQLNNVFLGLRLREVNAEMYEVFDANQNRRSAKRKGKGKCFDDEESD